MFTRPTAQKHLRRLPEHLARRNLFPDYRPSEHLFGSPSGGSQNASKDEEIPKMKKALTLETIFCTVALSYDLV
jgi:hypothetical protein